MSSIEKRYQAWMNLLENEAISNSNPSGFGKNAQIAAMIVIKNKPIVIGWNHAKSSPFYQKFGKNEDSIYAHAETHAIYKALKILSNTEDLTKATLLICRVKYRNFDRNRAIPYWGLAKPCAGCMNAIETFGIKRLVYSLDSYQPNTEEKDVVYPKKWTIVEI